jgi:hypothetical protein
VTDTGTIEAALRNPARSVLIECHRISADFTAPLYLVELHQLIPLREHEQPWVLVTEEEGEREIEAYDSFRRAEADLAEALDCLTTRYAEEYGGYPDEDED